MRFIRKSWTELIYLCCACVPGCGQMYQGYMKRGISQTIITCGLVFIAVFLEMGVLAVLIAPLWLYSFFDSYNLRRQIREDAAPSDEYLFGMSDMDSRRLNQLLNKRGSLIGWILVALGLYNVYRVLARRIFRALWDFLPWLEWLYDLMVWDMPRLMGTVLIIALGIWFIKGPRPPQDDEPLYTPPKKDPPPNRQPTPWTEAEETFHTEPEPQAPPVPEPEEIPPVTLTWKSEFDVEKFQKEIDTEKKEAPACAQRRVGTFTLGVVLVAAGAGMMASMFWPALDIAWLLKASPLILVLLGIEVLIAARGGARVRYDWLGMLLCVLLTGASLTMYAAAWYYVNGGYFNGEYATAYDCSRYADECTYRMSYGRFDGFDSHTLHLEAGDTLEGQTNTYTGWLEIEISGENGETLLEGTAMNEPLTVAIAKSGEYTILAHGVRTSGSFSFKAVPPEPPAEDETPPESETPPEPEPAP